MAAAVPGVSGITDVPAGDTLVKAPGDDPVNACCQAWVSKYSKAEKGRVALKKAVQILQRVHDDIQAENIRIKKAYDEELARADAEKNNRVSLESEISALESEISYLKQVGQSDVQDRDEEIMLLKTRVSEGENEINHIKELYENEKKRENSEKKKADANKKKAGKASKSEANAAEEDKSEEILLLKKQVSEGEKEINRLNELYEKEKKRADSEKKKAETNKKKACKALESKASAAEQYREEEIMLLRKQASETEKEMNQLKKLYEKEKRKADLEKKKAEASNKKAGKTSKRKTDVDEESNMSMESKGPQGYILQLEVSRKEVDDLKSKLTSENNKFEEAIRNLEVEKKVSAEERKRADLERAKSEELRKVAEATSKKATEEGLHAENLNEQLEMCGKRIEELEKMIETNAEKEDRLKEKVSLESKISMLNSEIISVTDKGLLEVQNRDEEIKLLQAEVSEKEKEINNLKMLYDKEKERADSEKNNAQVLMKESVKASESLQAEKLSAEIFSMQLEKARESIHELEKRMQENSDQFSIQLQEAMMKISALRKQIQENLQYRKASEVKEMNAKVAEIKFLKKQLKFEKKQVKHAKDVATLEKGRSCILQQELGHLKAEVVQILRRLDVSAKYFLNPAKDTNDFQKDDSFSDRQGLRENLYSLNTSQPFLQNENQFPVSGGIFTEPPSGIDSKLEPLLGGSNQKVLQSPALHSSTASFSDRRLVGSQGRGAFTVTTSTQLGEENCREQTLAGMPCDVADRCIENLAVVADNTVKSCIPIDTGKRENGLGHKRKRIVDAVESIENLCSKCKRLHLQLEDKLSCLHGMLNRKMQKQSEEAERAGCYLQGGSDVDGDIRAKKMEYSQEMTPKDPSLVREASQSVAIKDMGHGGEAIFDHATDVSGTLVSFEDVASGDYMKLLDLDNSADEECYMIASQMPLSPTLPDIPFQELESGLPHAENIRALKIYDVHEELNRQKENFAPCSCDVMNVENESNKVKSLRSDYSQDLLDHAKKGAFAFAKSLLTSENDSGAIRPSKSLGNPARRSDCVHNNAVLPGFDDEHRENSSESKMISATRSTPMSLVVSPDIKDSSSIHRILCATRRCLTESSLATETELALPKILVTLRGEDIAAKEKSCVFFSLLLLNFTALLTESCLKGDLSRCLESFSRHINQVILNAEAGILFSELCSDELLSVMKSFLIDGEAMVYDSSSGESTDCGSRLNILVDGVNLTLSSVAASTKQLVAGSIILASVCAAVGWTGFVCEVAYNILRMHRDNTFVLLTILHVFAFFGGETFLVSKNSSLVSMVVKSIVMHLEREDTLIKTGCLFSSAREANGSSCLLAECPFSKDTLPVDDVTLSILEKLENFSKLRITCSGVMVSTSNSSILPQMRKGEANTTIEEPSHFLNMACDKSSCLLKLRMADKQSETAVAVTLCDISDVLSLLELIACNMSWDWTYNRIILRLLRMLELPLQVDYIVAISTLVGHLGRLGVDAVGWEDERVKYLISQLSALLRRETRTCLSVQATILAAMLSLLNLKFEKIIRSDFNLSGTGGQFVPADEIRNWYHSLKKEQQELLMLLLHSIGVLKSQGL